MSPRRRSFEWPWPAVGLALVLAALAGTACDHRLGAREAARQGSRGLDEPSRSGAPGAVRWVWSGALQPTALVVKARLAGDASAVRLAVDGDATFASPQHFAAAAGANDPSVVTFAVAGLEPAREYHYAVELDGQLQRNHAGRFTTPNDGAFSFTLALGACARTGSNHPVFDEIRAHRPLLFLHLGDLHYENVSSREPGPYRDAYDRVLASRRQSALYRSVPVAYVWDDHDFTGNDSDRLRRGRAPARQVYREVVPHYPLAAGDGDAPIQQSFLIGRVLFVLTDGRSERTPRRRSDGPQKTMLGADQKAWLLERLAEAPRHGLAVWVNTLPWIAPPRTGADDWGGYTAERREIAAFVAGRGIGNLVMVSGDAHMLAIDDGSHNRYAGGERPGFPVLQAAALDRDGSVKGGPYSEGTFPGGGQYALMRVDDDGGKRIRVRWEGRRHGSGIVVALDLEFAVPAAAAR